jgi:hypothetical protein
VGNIEKEVDIPKTKEYGWSENGKGVLVYKASIKVVTNRIRFIVESVGGSVESTTTGFKISNSDSLTQDHIDQMTAERTSLGVIGYPKDISRSDDGLEEPNFEGF